MRTIRATVTYVVPLSDHLEGILREMGDEGVEVDDPEEAFTALDMHLDEFEVDADWGWE